MHKKAILVQLQYKPGSICDPIGQHQTTFSIRVVDFNCLFRKVVFRDELIILIVNSLRYLSRIHCVDIIRSSCLGSHRILSKAQNCEFSILNTD